MPMNLSALDLMPHCQRRERSWQWIASGRGHARNGCAYTAQCPGRMFLGTLQISQHFVAGRSLSLHGNWGAEAMVLPQAVFLGLIYHRQDLVTRFASLRMFRVHPVSHLGRRATTIFRRRSRSRLLVFLLVLLPLQLCWAAVGAYCNDDGPGSLPLVAMHCCEHAQLRDGAMNESTRVGDAVPSADCGSCHLQGSEALQTQRDLVPDLHQKRFHTDTRGCPSSESTSRPERPQWHALA